jgi:hypothetical protein
MHTSYYPTESLDEFEAGTPEYGKIESIEAASVEDAVFSETEEMELAEGLLEVADERELAKFLDALIARALGGSNQGAPLQPLRVILRQAAKGALPAICGPAAKIQGLAADGASGGRVASMAGNLLGLEFEGVGGEDHEFEVARHFVRFAGNCARNFPHFHASAPPEVAARRAVGVAVLQELYESPRLDSEGPLNFEYPLLLADDEELEYFLGGLVRSVSRAVGSAAKAVVKNPIKALRGAATGLVRGVADVSSSFADTLGKIPIIGAGLKGLYGFTYGTLIQSAANVVSGVRLDKVVSRHFESQVQNIKEVAPYVQTVISLVPGIGPGISGAVSAGLTLAQGKPLDEALIAAAIGAVPGGALAKSMAQMAVAAASGKSLSDIAVSALPIPPAAKEALQAGLRVASDVAQGKRVDKSLLAEANRQIERLPAQYRKAAQIGIALGQGKKLQDVAMQQLPTLIAAGGPLARAGRTIAMQSPVLRQARGLVAHGQHGFDIAQGLLARGSVPFHEINRVRSGFRGAALKGFDAAIALHRRSFASRRPTRELESFGQFEAQTPEYGAIESGEAVDSGAEDAIFGETEEMELGAQLLEITGENELDEFLEALIARATGGERRLASSPHLRRLLRQAAKSALPMIGDTAEKLVGSLGGTVGARLAAAAGDLFGLELEGLSPEDQEFEVARRFVRFAGASARNTRRSRGNVPPKLAAQRAADAAARRHAPGFLRRRQPRDVRGWSYWADSAPAPPIPIAVTCHCCGTQQTVEVPGTIGDRNSSDNTLPDNEPTNSNSAASQPKPEETKMHDIDRTTMEISDEADFEFSEAQDESGPEGPFSEEEEAEHAAQLLEINDEAELDQFLGSLLNLAGRAAKARGFSLGNLKSQLLRPLGGFLKGAIKKALPIAGDALGNMIAPGIGGQTGSRLASGAGDLLGFEYETLAPEDQAFEVAKRMVRMVGDAVQNAAQAAPTADPKSAAKSAVIAAAQTHVPGLLQAQPQPAVPGHHHRPRTGKWYRRGHKILLIGV